MKKILIASIIFISLNACTSPYASTGERQYLKSVNGSQLIVPAPLTEANLTHFYDLPAPTHAAVKINPPV